MSTINAVSKPHVYQTAPQTDDSVAASGKAFPQALKTLQTPATWLTTPDAASAQRPNIKAFMDRTGANLTDASELLYGVVGSNTDVRNWAAIMASSDPVTAARQATGQMYGRTNTPVRAGATYLGSHDTLAKSGNFAVRSFKDDEQQILDQGVKLIDAQGLLLRDAGTSPEQIVRQAWLFGFDTQSLAPLAAAASTISPELGQAVKTASQQSTAIGQLTVPATPMAAVTTSPVIASIPIALAELPSPAAVALNTTINPNVLHQDQASYVADAHPTEPPSTASTTSVGLNLSLPAGRALPTDLALPADIALPADLTTDYLALFEPAQASVEQSQIEAAPAIEETEPTSQDDELALANMIEDAAHQSLGYVDSARYLNAMFNT